MDNDRERILRESQKLTHGTIARLRSNIIRAYGRGEDPAEAFAQALPEIEGVLLDGLLVSHVMATARTKAMMRRVVGLELDRSDFTAMLERAMNGADVGPDQLRTIRAQYAAVAAEESKAALDAAQNAIGESARKIAASGVNRIDALSQIRDAIDRAGLPAQSPRLLETVYRTEFNTAYSGARLLANEDPAIQDILWGFQYVTIGDDRVRPTHRRLDKTRWDKDDPEWKRIAPPNGFNCFVPGTKVEGAFVAGLHAEYSGPVVTVETARGHRLTVTANHPVLTAKGWIKASLLCEGDTLFSDTRGVDDFDSGSKIDEQNAPSLIEDVVNSLGTHGSRLAKVSPLDLYGDAKFFEGKINVVGSNPMLRRDLLSQCCDRITNLALKLSNAARAGFHCLSALYPFADRTHAPLACSPCGATLPANRGGVLFDSGPFDRLGFALPTSLTDLLDYSDYCASTVPQVCGNRIDRIAREMSLVNDIGIGARRNAFSGSLSPVLAEEGDNGSDIDAIASGDRHATFPPVTRRENIGGVRREVLRCGLAANIDAVAGEKFGETVEVHTRFLRQLTERSAGLIAADQIVKVVHGEYSGTVYDGETLTGWILSNGIVTSNCRCSFIEIFKDEKIATPKRPTGDYQPDEGFDFYPAA